MMSETLTFKGKVLSKQTTKNGLKVTLLISKTSGESSFVELDKWAIMESEINISLSELQTTLQTG